MKVDSREFQCQLKGPRFADRPSGIQSSFSFVADFDPHVALHTDGREDLQFEEFFLDTAGGDFAARQVHLRACALPDRITCTHKAIARDRYWLKKMRVECTAKNARTKLEEDVYGYHSMFAWETACSQPLRKWFPTVGDWAELYAGTEDICATDRPPVAVPSCCSSRQRL